MYISICNLISLIISDDDKFSYGVILFKDFENTLTRNYNKACIYLRRFAAIEPNTL